MAPVGGMTSMMDHSMERAVAARVLGGRSEIGTDDLRRRRFLIFQIREVFVFVLVDLKGRKKLSVVVARSEAEMRSAEAAEDAVEVTAVDLRCLGHAAGAIVVSGDSERPTAERIIIVA